MRRGEREVDEWGDSCFYDDIGQNPDNNLPYIVRGK